MRRWVADLPVGRPLTRRSRGYLERKGFNVGRGGARLAQGGFSLLELVVVIVLIVFLMQIALARLLAMQADAERVAMETVLGTLRSALGMKVAESIVKGTTADLAALETSNPMERLAELPRNYLGEFDTRTAEMEDGGWYFDRTERALIYLVRNRSHFSGGVVDPPRARFRVTLVYADRNGNGRYEGKIDAVEGLRLAPLEPYQWVR